MMRFTHNRLSSGAFLALILLNLALLLYLGFGMRSRLPGPPEGRPPGPHAPSRIGTFLEKELTLRPDQVAQFEELRRTHFEQTRTIHRELRRNRQKLFDSLTKSPEEAAAIAQQIGDSQQQMELQTFQHFADLRAICDPSQQQKLDVIVKDLLARMAPPGRPGPGPPPGGGPPSRQRPPTPRPSSP